MRRIIPKIKGYTKIQVLSFVKMKIKSNPTWATRACVTIYNQQTLAEKRAHLSIGGYNGCGFSRTDAPILSNLACKANQHRLTLEDVNQLQHRMPKYAGQLICIMYEKDKCKKLKEDHLKKYYKWKQADLPF